MNIASLGWGEALAETFQPYADAGLRPGRVAIQHRGAYVLLAEEGEVWANVSGRLRHAADSTAELPAVGDWVRIRLPARLRAGRNPGHPAPPVRLSPKAGRARDGRAGRRRQRRRPLPRHVAQPGPERPPDRALHDAGLGERRRPGRRPHQGRPVSDDEPAAVRWSSRSHLGVPVHVTSALTGAGFESCARSPRAGRTGAAVGSSGVGKSTLINRLGRRGAARDARDPRRRPRAAHDDPPRADRPSRRRLRHRHARHARAPALGGREGSRGRSRTSTPWSPVPFLATAHTRPSPAARCGRRSRTAGSTPSASRATASSSASCRYLEIRHDARARSEARKRWRAINKEARARARP